GTTAGADVRTGPQRPETPARSLAARRELKPFLLLHPGRHPVRMAEVATTASTSASILPAQPKTANPLQQVLASRRSLGCRGSPCGWLIAGQVSIAHSPPPSASLEILCIRFIPSCWRRSAPAFSLRRCRQPPSSRRLPPRRPLRTLLRAHPAAEQARPIARLT